MTRIPAATAMPPKVGLPSANAHAAQPNDSEVSSVTKIRWKAFNDILMRLGSGRKIVQRVNGQHEQSGDEKHGETQDGVNHFLLGQ